MKLRIVLLLALTLPLWPGAGRAGAEPAMPELPDERGVAILDASRTSAVLPVGDLDRDGRPDLVAATAKPLAPGLYEFNLRALTETPWSYTGRGAAARFRGASLGGGVAGGGGGGGVMLEVWTQLEGPFGSLGNLHLTMLDGTGASLWDRPIPGNALGLGSAGPRSRWMVAGVAGLLRGPDGAQHPLVETRSSVPTGMGRLSITEARLYNAGNGTPLGWSADHAFGQDVRILVAGDLTGDGLEDYFAVTAGGGLPSRIVSHDSGGNVNWFFEGPARLSNDLLVTTPGAKGAHADLDGDGIPDVLVTEPSASGTPGAAGAVTHALSGADGRFVWNAQADLPGAVADLDGDGLPDLAAQTVYPDHLEYTGLSGASGATKWKIYTPLPTSLSFTRIRDTDSAPDDGFFAMGHVIEGGPVVDKGLVNGLTGAMLWIGDVGTPLAASVDGKGDDLLLLKWMSPEVLSVAAQDGATGRTIWGHTSDCDDKDPARIGGAADLDGDGRAEVIVGCTPPGRNGTRWSKVSSGGVIVVLDGSQ